MRKDNRRRWKWLTAGALVVACLTTTTWLYGRERTLVDMAHTVGPMNENKQRWIWVSDEELLVVTTDREPANLYGKVTEEIHWQGHAELWNVVSGKHRQLSGLTALLNREGVSPTGIPSLIGMSPNRTWLRWDNHKTLDSWPFPVAAYLDGTHFREWSSETRGSGFFLDDNHWVEQSIHDAPTTFIFDLQDAKKDRKYPADTAHAKAIFAEYAVGHPQFVSVDTSKPEGPIELNTYRTEDTVLWEIAQEHEGQKEPSPVQTSSLQLSRGASAISGEPSPQQQTILYHLSAEHANPVMAFLHRFIPVIPKVSVQTESLWISKADGKGFHEIGHVVVDREKAENTDDNAEQDGLSHVEWMPGGKQASFVYHHTLYVVPVS